METAPGGTDAAGEQVMAAVRVYPGASNPTHELSLSDGVQTWGLRLDGGPEALKETPLTPSTLRLSGVSGFGAWEPGLAQIEQRDWSGGRGAPRFSRETATRYLHSHNAWTLTPGVLHPVPQWRFARGLRATIQVLPGDVSWKSLLGEQRYLAAKFTVGGANLAAKTVRIWLRRVGSPGGLGLSFFSDSSGAPGSLLAASAGLSSADVTDVISELGSFALTATLLAGTSYHIVIGGAVNDNAANHWELAVQELTDDGHSSADASSWAAANCRAYFRIEDAHTERNFLFFRLGGAQYAVDQSANGSASHVYLNGERGVATGFSATHIDDMHKLWTPSQWEGAWVRIMKGKGAGQARLILSNGPADLQVAAWDITPDATSEYLIYATDVWQDVSPLTGDLIDGVVLDVAIVNEHAIFAQGESVPLLRMRFNSALATPAHEFDDDGANVADLLHTFHHPISGPQLWRGILSTGEVARAVPANWLTALTFGAAIKVGERSQPLRELFDWNSQLWVLKGDSFWQVNDNDQAQRINVGLESYSRDWGAQPLLTWNGRIYFAWGASLLSTNGNDLQDLGHCSQGVVTGVAPLGGSQLAVALDNRGGCSTVLVWHGDAWHEIFRAPQPGKRIGNVAWQECPASQPRLWITLDGELISISLPRETQHPLDDADLRYQHEAVLVGSSVDMEAARLPKFLREVSLLSANLGPDAQVALDYQVDSEIGSVNWRHAGFFSASPLDTLALNAGPLHSVRTRLRLLTSKASAPAVVHATVLEGFARTPLRYQWELRIKLADLQADGAGGLDADPEAFMLWIQQAARQARRIHLRSIWAGMDDRYVIVEPPALVRQFSNSALQWWGGTATLKIREA